MTEQGLVTAAGLEERGILKKGTAYRMAKLKLIPCSYIGPKRGGVRFDPREVLAALKRPVVTEKSDT
jgi:hypothetical protein